MSLAILSNAVPPGKAAPFQRGSSLTRVLLALSGRVEAEAAEIRGPLSVFVAQPSAWLRADGVSSLRFRDAGGVLAARLDERPKWLWIDFDPTAGSARDRLDFLRLAGTVAASVEADGGALGLAIAEDVGAIGESMFFSGRAFSCRRILQRLAERCSRQISFSTMAAAGLTRRFRRRFELFPVPSLIPNSSLSQGKARSELGLEEEGQDLLVGVVGRYGTMDWDLLHAGLREALRLSPGARVLYMGPDGQQLRGRAIPLPLLDAGTPAPSEIALRLRAVDLMILPFKDGGRADDQAILSCLCNGTPVVATAPATGMDPSFGPLPEGFNIVPGSELGAYLEAVESACERALRGPGREIEEGLRAYYHNRFSAEEVWRRFFGATGEKIVVEMLAAQTTSPSLNPQPER